MTIYQLQPGSHNYVNGAENQFLEDEILTWATDVANMLDMNDSDITLAIDSDQDITLLFDDYNPPMDIYRALDILAQSGEYLEPMGY